MTQVAERIDVWRQCDCGDVLVWVDKDPALAIWVVECVECGYEAGVPRREVDPSWHRERRIERAKLPGFGEWESNPAAKGATDYCRSFVLGWPNERPPFLWSKPGRGKTHLLSMTAEQVMRRCDVQARYATMADLLDAASRAMDEKDESAQAVWDRHASCDLLVLDDIGAERHTEYALDRLQQLIDRRYRDGLPVMCASNLDPVELDGRVGGRVASRLAEMTVSVFVGGDDWRQR